MLWYVQIKFAQNFEAAQKQENIWLFLVQSNLYLQGQVTNTSYGVRGQKQKFVYEQ